MAFKVAFVARAPDADAEKHRCVIDTGKFKLFVVVARDQGQAVAACSKLAKEEGIHSICLCPGFTHRDIAQIAAAVGEKVSVTVARGDGPGNRVVMEVMKREGWFSGKRKA
ncbi:MAG: DUF6506 family protein [Candidatus Zixiibacteriota bacterium]